MISSSGEQASVVMKFTQAYDMITITTHQIQRPDLFHYTMTPQPRSPACPGQLGLGSPWARSGSSDAALENQKPHIFFRRVKTSVL